MKPNSPNNLLKRITGKIARSLAPAVIPYLPGSSTKFGPPRSYSWSCRSWLESKRGSNARLHPVLDAIEFANVSARHVEKILPQNLANPAKISVNAQFVAELPGGRVVGNDPTIITEDDHILLDLSMLFAPYHDDIFFKALLPNCRVINAPVLVLAGKPGTNYGHWIHQMLPRLFLAEESGWKPSDFGLVVINATPNGFAEETLIQAGFDASQLIRTSPELHIQGSPLVVPSIPAAGSPPEWISSFLRSRFCCNQGKPFKRIYTSRANARWRRITNESSLYPILNEFGFDIVFPESLDFPSTVKLFESADVVCGMHGANLSSICFCNPGSTLIEIYHPQHPDLYFWTTATGAGLNYCFLLGEGPINDVPDLSPGSPGNHSDVAVNPQKFKSALLAAGLKPVQASSS